MEFTKDQEITIRFQLAFGLGMLAVAMVIFWIASQAWTVDIKFVVFAVAALLALTWLKDSLVMLADVAIIVMTKMKNKGA